MKFVVDESVDIHITKVLQEANYEIISITDQYSGETDDRVLEIAYQENAILITEDKDFGELIFRLQKQNYGVTLIRLNGLTSEKKAKIVLNAIQANSLKLIKSFTTIDHNFVRIRTPIL